MKTESATLDIGGVKVGVTHLDKVLYPQTGFTKGDLIDYYIRISAHLLPHLENRPLTLKRYPNGVDGFFFYERNCPSHRPKWIRTSKVEKDDGGSVNYCVINELPSLVWAANLADLELHTFLHTTRAPKRPTTLALDLDPGPPANIISCCEVALWIRSLLSPIGLQCFVKTSGSKGLQIYIPLHTPVNYARTKAFAHALAQTLERAAPRAVVSKMQKSLRKGKVLIDWSQNDAHKTTVNVYSLRAKTQPTVSTPVEWEEVERAWKKKQPSLLSFLWSDVLKRVEKQGDLFAPVLKLQQQLPPLAALKRIET